LPKKNEGSLAAVGAAHCLPYIFSNGGDSFAFGGVTLFEVFSKIGA